MIQLCYMKFFDYCESNGFVIRKNKYSTCSLNICLEKNESKFVPFPLNKHPFTTYDLEFFLLAFKKYKLFNYDTLIDKCHKKVTDVCPIGKYFEIFPHTMELNNHCPPRIIYTDHSKSLYNSNKKFFDRNI